MSPSSAALKLDFSSRSASGESEAISRSGDVGALGAGEGDHGVDEAHVERLIGVVEPAQEPDLLRLADAHRARQEPGPEPAVEASTRGPVWPKRAVVGRDREVADEVQDLPAPDRAQPATPQ